ncbi:MAG: hypothetical protein V4477_11700, partial [Pseudomonadota bacterium]
MKQAGFPSIRVVTESPQSSRLGSQAQHAPPALTFGLPGKQSVKGMGAERDLMRLWKTLAEVWPTRPRELRRLRGGHRRV